MEKLDFGAIISMISLERSSIKTSLVPVLTAYIELNTCMGFHLVPWMMTIN